MPILQDTLQPQTLMDFILILCDFLVDRLTKSNA